MEEKKYYIQDLEGSPGFGLVEVGEKALGGQDAMEFTSGLHDVDPEKVKVLLVDLSENKYMNSSGLGMLVGGLSSMKKKGIKLALVNIPPKVKELLKMTHLEKVFKTYDDIESAVKDLK